MAAKKELSSKDLRNASAKKSCCSIIKLAQNLKNYGEALACSLAASNLQVKIGLTRKLGLLVAAYRLRRSAKRVLLAIERYDNRAFFEALERFKKARGYYYRLIACCEGAGNAHAISRQVREILGYHLEISLHKLVEDCRESLSRKRGSKEPLQGYLTNYEELDRGSGREGEEFLTKLVKEQEGLYLRRLQEEYQASLETVFALKKGQNSGNPRVCPIALRACLTLDVIIIFGLDLARQLMTANLPHKEKRKFIKEVFPKIKRMVDAEITNAGLNYDNTWGGLLSLAKKEAKAELSRNSQNQEGQGPNFLGEVSNVYEALLTATLGGPTKKATEGEVPETPPRAGSTEQVLEIFDRYYRYKNGGSQNHRTSRSTPGPYN
jgi:hypothetical protein